LDCDPGEQFPGSNEAANNQDELVGSPDSVEGPDEDPEEVESKLEL